MFVPSNTFDDLKVVLYILKFVGILPVLEISSFTQSKKLYFYLKHVLRCSLVVFLVYNIITSGCLEIYEQSDVKFETTVANLLIEFYLGLCAYTIVIIANTKNALKYLQIMEKIENVDVDLKNQFDVVLGSNCAFLNKFTFGLLVCQLNVYVWSAMKDSLSVRVCLLIALYIIQNTTFSAYIIFISALLRVVGYRFSFLGSVFKQLSHKEEPIPLRLVSSVNTTCSSFTQIVSSTFHVYSKLIQIQKAINKCSELSVISFFAYGLYGNATTFYVVFIDLELKRFTFTNSQIALCWMVLHVTLYVLLTTSCAYASREVRIS